MVEAAPAAALVMPKAEFLLEFLVIALDPPAQLGQIDQSLEGDIKEKVGEQWLIIDVCPRVLSTRRPSYPQPFPHGLLRGKAWARFVGANVPGQNDDPHPPSSHAVWRAIRNSLCQRPDETKITLHSPLSTHPQSGNVG